MRAILVILSLMVSLSGLTAVCTISGRYRCNDGSLGDISGRGPTIEDAKENARLHARDLCRGSVDFVRFAERSAHCSH